ncbi:MAG: FAD binding domain-containing protein [Rhodospirillales bacterium]|nr:FAD binding domain-containing protein [Rhodospirillales bacterium]
MDYAEPTSIEEAVELLAGTEDSRCLAGGATLVAMINADLVEPAALISLRRIEGISDITQTSDGSIHIGAMTPHMRVAGSGLFSAGQRIVPLAADNIGHPPIRNMGTIGGSICHADPAADYPAALCAIQAQVEIMGPAGQRSVTARDFFIDYFETALESGEMVTGVTVPKAPDNSWAAFEKIDRTEGDFATASLALVVGFDGPICNHAGIAVGGCGPAPVWVAEAEERLVGSELDDGALEAAGALLAQACDPMEDVRGSAEYRLKLVPRLLKRAAREGEK